MFIDDQAAMQLALAAAHTVEGRTSPRPSVGAVVLQAGRVLGQGATSPPYGPHAEIHALNAAGPAALGADLYTTLEPCCVTVHTPPCTTAIINAGIRRVIIGSLDPNPLVYAKGMAQLQSAGIEVLVGVSEQACFELIRPFATLMARGRPYVTAKWAMTLDGKIATSSGDARWISGPRARVWVHNLRDRVDAILIGSQTAILDDPQLTVRLAHDQRIHPRLPRQGPLRVVLATHGNLPTHLALLQPELAQGTCIIVGETCPSTNRERLQALGLELLSVPVNLQGHIDLHAALIALAHKGVMHILLEGGSQLLGSAFDQSLIDHVAVFISPKLIGGATAFTPIKGTGLSTMQHALRLQCIHTQLFDEDILVEGELEPTVENVL